MCTLHWLVLLFKTILILSSFDVELRLKFYELMQSLKKKFSGHWSVYAASAVPLQRVTNKHPFIYAIDIQKLDIRQRLCNQFLDFQFDKRLPNKEDLIRLNDEI